MNTYIGIDLGTSAVKLILTDDSGAILRTVSKTYPLLQPRAHWSEQNPEDWWLAVCDGIAELTAGMNPADVKGVGVGGQMHGLVMLDANDNVLRPAILWNDTRTGKETAYLNDVIGKDRLQNLTGNIAFAGFTAPKILWVKENEPAVFAACKKICLPKDYINYKLTGVFATDVSDASGTLYFDVANRCWSKPMLDLLGIDEAMLPQVFESEDVIGKTTLCGLDAAVVAGAGDNAAAAIGTNTVRAGQCNISLGTSGTIFISSDKYSVDPNGALHSFDHADGTYHLMGCMLSAASCNKWWMDEILQTKDYGAEQAAIEKLGENHVYYLPYLMGERSPWNNPNARATFIGMTMDSTRADMTQAVLEGVAFAVRDMYEVAKSLGTDIARTKICGGGAKSPLWRKMVANILNLPVDIPVSEEGPGMGGAMLAMVACGAYASVEEAANAIVKVAGTEEPDPELVAKYEARYQQFKAIYPALKPVFDVIV